MQGLILKKQINIKNKHNFLLMNKINNFLIENKKYSITVVRLGLAFVLLWFGINQLINPESFLGYVPQWLYKHDITMLHEHPLQLMHNIQVPSVHVVLMSNAIFETIAGLLLLIGFYTRIAAFIAALHLLAIAFSLGYNDIAIRDVGLTLMAASLVFSGAGPLSLDNKKKK